jgi:hypothetical protein
VDPAGGVLHDGEAVQPCQRDGLGMKEVNRQDADGRCCEELLPARAGSPRRRSIPAFFKMARTVDGATLRPSPASSPVMRR